MKKRFRTIKKKFSPLLLIPIVLLAAILVGGYFLIFSGGDDKSDTARLGAPAQSSNRGPDVGTQTKPKDPTKGTPEQPTGKEITLDSDRDEKDYATVQATGAIKTPARISVRLGAAPKQPVRVNWNIVCLLPTEGAKSSSDTFTVTPPAMRDLKLPVPPEQAVSCTATANAQLTLAGKGRIKVFLLGKRRPAA